MENGVRNGVEGLRMIDRDTLKAMEPNADGNFALYVPTAGILCPFTYTIALAENAAQNGVQYLFDHEVVDISRSPEGEFVLKTSQEPVCARWVINCAGLYAYKISAMLGFAAYIPNRVKGQYEILDKKTGKFLSMPVYPTPNEAGEFDVHVTPTIDGNVLVGPTIENIQQNISYDVTQDMINILSESGEKMFAYVKRDYFIRNYAGVFPTVTDPATGKDTDFVIEASKEIPHAVNLVGINSPGLTSALPIARRVVKLVLEQESLQENVNFNPVRKGITRFAEQSVQEQNRLIQSDPDYGEIFCRCECVTKAEIKQAVHNILGVRTVSGIKYRTRATMGRCQGGYCETRIAAILQDEADMRKEDILLNKNGAYLFTGKVK